MKDVRALENKCRGLLENVGIYPDYDKVVINSRAKRRWGSCKFKNGGCIIEISDRLLNDNVPDKSAEETMIHEMLHSVRDNRYEGHMGMWLKEAIIVNRVYGYNIKRCSSPEEKGVDIQPVQRYALKCNKCGKIVYRYRLSKVIKHPELYRCKCGGSLVSVRVDTQTERHCSVA